jgi:uncharacterized protein (TIGR02217 family)
MAFHEVRFPTGIGFGSSGGPERRTQIVTLASGREARNATWADSRRRYNAGYGVRGIDDLHAVIAFFEARAGRLHGFRFKDWTDYRSGAPGAMPGPGDQTLGTGDGVTTGFDLVKTYVSGSQSYVRAIAKPVAGSVRVAVAGVELAAAAFAVDAAGGRVTLAHAPEPGATVTAGFEFDVPVRFDTDFLDIDLTAFRAGQIPSIPRVEIRV